MSETIVALKVEFSQQDNAVLLAKTFRNHKTKNINEIILNAKTKQGGTVKVPSGWFLTKIKRKKQILDIEITGPPSESNFDGIIEWLTNKGAEEISGKMISTRSDAVPIPFRYINGISIEPSINVKLFLKHFSKGEGISQRNGVGMGPLHVAAESGNVGLAKALLVLGTPINDDSQCQAPITFAINNNRNEMVKFLFKNGATPPPDKEFQRRCVDQAIKNCNPKLVELILQKGFCMGIHENQFNLDKELLIQIYEEELILFRQELEDYKTENRTYNPYKANDDLAEKYNFKNIRPLYGGGKWDSLKVKKAVKIGEALVKKKTTVNKILNEGFLD